MNKYNIKLKVDFNCKQHDSLKLAHHAIPPDLPSVPSRLHFCTSAPSQRGSQQVNRGETAETQNSTEETAQKEGGNKGRTDATQRHQ